MCADGARVSKSPMALRGSRTCLGRRENVAAGLPSLGWEGRAQLWVVGDGEWPHRRVQACTLLWRFRKRGSKSGDHYSPIFLLTAFSCWFRTFCSDFVM